MNKSSNKIKFWFWYRNILNLNYSEFFSIIVSIIVTISIAYPQIKDLKVKENNFNVEFRSDDGSIISGKVIVENNENTLLSILSIIGIILGPIILIWKFIIESKDIDKFYNKILKELNADYNELMKNSTFHSMPVKQEIDKIFQAIDINQKITKKELLQLKEKIYATQQAIKKHRA